MLNMRIHAITGALIDVQLAQDDAAMLARICEHASEHDLFTERGQEHDRMLLEAFGAAFGALGTGALAIGNLDPASINNFEEDAKGLGLPAKYG